MSTRSGCYGIGEYKGLASQGLAPLLILVNPHKGREEKWKNHSEEGESTAQTIERLYGAEAVKLIEALI